MVQGFNIVCVFVCLSFQSEDFKTSSEQVGEIKTIAEGRTRSVRSFGTAELIRPQRLKYFESTSCPVFLWSTAVECEFSD